MFFKVAFALYFAGLVYLSFAALTRDDVKASAFEAQEAARHWIAVGVVQPARLEDDEWEVDVLRPDGSLVEVTFDHYLHLRNFDEELGPDGTWAQDEVRGPLRRRAIRAARDVTGPGYVSSVERDSANEMEVNIWPRARDGVQIEVELDAELHVGEVEPEDPGDE